MSGQTNFLSTLSGLEVRKERLFKEGKVHNVYRFYGEDGDRVKEFFTFPKAKAFAQGIHFANNKRQKGISRPYPRHCVCCGEITVNKTTIRHQVNKLYNGKMHSFSLERLVVDQCSSCGDIYFTADTDEQIESVFKIYLKENSNGKIA